MSEVELKSQNNAPVNETRRKARKYLNKRKREPITVKQLLDPLGHNTPKNTDFFHDKAKSDDEILELMRLNVGKAGSDFMKSIRRADLYARGIHPKQQARALQEYNKEYANMMVLSCVDPLARGISVETVFQTVGMGAAMWLMSKNFRKEVGSRAYDVQDNILKRFDKRIDKKMAKAVAKSDKKQEKGKEVGDKYIRKWMRRYERAQKRQRGGLEPFSPHSAAMTSVALMENAYAMMRREGADAKKIADECNILQKHLYKMAYEDGIDAEDIDTMVRVVCRVRMIENPGLHSVFNETAHGDFLPTGDITDLKDTNLFYSSTKGFDSAGSLSVRPPATEKEHWQKIHDLFVSHFDKLNNDKDIMLVMSNYSFAHGTYFHEDMRTRAENSLGANFAKVGQAMIQSMSDDGVPDEACKEIYANALMASIDEFCAKNPNFMAGWPEEQRLKFMDNISKTANDPYSAFMARAENTAEANNQNDYRNAGPEDVFDETERASDKAGPEHMAEYQKYQKSRRNQQYNAGDSKKASAMMDNVDTDSSTSKLERQMRQMGVDGFQGPDVDFEMG